MKILKLLFVVCVIGVLFASCAQPKTLKTKSGEYIDVQPFGWANEDSQKNDSVIYQINGGNVALSIIFSEIIVVPVYITGWELYEPVRFKNTNELNQETDYTNVFIGIGIFFFLFYYWWKKK
jgi:hypothetical protein